ncbi:MAG: Fur family transcriptional regulator [Planctomycetota bacterium]|jgi:Fur family ferric uptake transcriptional regulator|nr:Fur family transcriptional regulator [Planctomycetota bacterium]
MKVELALERFVLFLRGKGLRVTTPRREVLTLAWATHEHFGAEDLYAWAKNSGSSASRATVYRTLSLLVEGGFLGVLDTGKGHALYEHILGHKHHDHMVCLQCRLIIEFRDDQIEQLQEEAASKYGFELMGHSLTLEGHCSSCSQEGESAADPS